MEEANMPAAHEPRDEFVDQLELRLRADLRRHGLAAGRRTWMPQSRIAAAFAIAAGVIASMALGGGVVAATYEARISEQRDLLLGTFEQRAAIARQRLSLASEQLREAQKRVSVGVAPQDTVAEAQLRVIEAEAEVKSIDLDIAEVRAAGREPMQAVSAPLVSGRDFVTDRWRVQLAVPSAAMEIERTRLESAKKRFDVGVATPTDVDAAAARLIELETAVEVLRQKIALRQAFLKGGVPPAIADLRGLEAEVDLRRTALARRIDVARREVQDLNGRTEVGTANPLQLAAARLRLQELELERTKADYDLLLIRKQLGKE
jgi:hypothetical protein